MRKPESFSQRDALADVADEKIDDMRIAFERHWKYGDPWFPANQEEIPAEYAPS